MRTLADRKVFESIAERLAVAMEEITLEVSEMQGTFEENSQMHEEFLRRGR